MLDQYHTEERTLGGQDTSYSNCLFALAQCHLTRRRDAGDSAPKTLSKRLCSESNAVDDRCGKNSSHRALSVPEIVRLIFGFVQAWDAESPAGECIGSVIPTEGKKSLAYLARTCHFFHEPAIDALWTNLESIDPLIKLLPRRMWAKSRYPLLVRKFMRKKHWDTFQKYASRVKTLRGPSYGLTTATQHAVMAAIASYPKATRPLFPQLTVIVWREIRTFHRSEPCVSLLKYFMGPSVTQITLKLHCWPYHIRSEMDVLAEMSNICPNVISFTAQFPPSSHNDPCEEVGDIVRNWKRLRALHSCALPQSVMDQLISQNTLSSLAIELNNSIYPPYIGQLPESLHTFSLGGSSAITCTRYLKNIHASPTSLTLRIGADDSTIEDIAELFRILPDHFSNTTVQTFSSELTSSYWMSRSTETFRLDLAVLRPILVFTSLRTVDLSFFSTAGLDDDACTTMAQSWPALESLELGTADILMEHPVATVRGLIAFLAHCPYLTNLAMAFDGTCRIPEVSDIPSGVANTRIEQINVAHSPLMDVNAMATCLGTLMPCLKKVDVNQIGREDDRESDGRWEEVQKMLTCSLRSQGINTD
ncbi:hypothetical protein EDC04DRAFT_2904035 [Pisolithus marmoratus]|nr:hypothetical protein EDC04DRAFT_2904035 [Pisolithus marmoratus]